MSRIYEIGELVGWRYDAIAGVDNAITEVIMSNAIMKVVDVDSYHRTVSLSWSMDGEQTVIFVSIQDKLIWPAFSQEIRCWILILNERVQ